MSTALSEPMKRRPWSLWTGGYSGWSRFSVALTQSHKEKTGEIRLVGQEMEHD